MVQFSKYSSKFFLKVFDVFLVFVWLYVDKIVLAEPEIFGNFTQGYLLLLISTK